MIVHQPMGSSEENHSSTVEEAKNTAGTRDYKKLGGSHVVVQYIHYFKVYYLYHVAFIKTKCYIILNRSLWLHRHVLFESSTWCRNKWYYTVVFHTLPSPTEIFRTFIMGSLKPSGNKPEIWLSSKSVKYLAIWLERILFLFYMTFGVLLTNLVQLKGKSFRIKDKVGLCNTCCCTLYRTPSEESEIPQQRDGRAGWVQGGRRQRRQSGQQSAAEGRCWRRHGPHPLPNLLPRTSASHLQVLVLWQMIDLTRFQFLVTVVDLFFE